MMKSTLTKNILKTVSGALFGAVLMVGFALIPGKKVNAVDKPTQVPDDIDEKYWNEYCYFEHHEGREDSGTLYLFGNVANEGSGIILPVTGTDDFNLPEYLDKELVLSIVAKSGTKLPANCEFIFCDFENATSIDLSNADTSLVTSMKGFFDYDKNMTNIVFGNNWNTTNVTNMSMMFHNCQSLVSVDLSNFNTAKVTDMSSMFCECRSLVTLDLSSFDTREVTDMNSMFNVCYDLESIQFGSGFITSKVTDMNAMFRECITIETLDLSTFDTHNVTNMHDMFNMEPGHTGWYLLETIYVTPGKWDTSKVTDATDIFLYCKNLVGENGTKCFPTYRELEYARVDRPGEPGYLSTYYTPYAQLTADTDFTFTLNVPLGFNLDDSSEYAVTFDGNNITYTEFDLFKKDNYCYLPITMTYAAKEIADKKVLTIKKLGVTVYEKSISIADYLKQIMEDSSLSKYHAVAGSMLRYGAAAQVYFNNNYDNDVTKLANYGVTGYDSFNIPYSYTLQSYDATEIDNATRSCGVSYAGMSTIFESKLTFMVAFKLPDGVTSLESWKNYDDFKDMFTKDFYDQGYNDLEFGLDTTEKYVIVYKRNVDIMTLDQNVFTIGNSKLSIPQYLYRAINNSSISSDFKALAKALYAYHLEAKKLNQ